ncbi:hypothetical protein ACH5RR_014416 [Cinchona calisaya]|uniref:Protein NUCLEAR FUSION DEFECTIVE 6, chloroplastic/mitochondrial-like n=1 Tax=Cinchona calisaya TaxID=153742 RepID=A0ABD3A2W3_9GENT
MASNCARRLLQRSSSSAKNFLISAPRISPPPSVGSGPSAKFSGLPSSASRLSRCQNLFSKSRLPVELGCGESLMPFHSVTASALLKSMLSSEVGQWGCLSEAVTPLDKLPLSSESFIVLLAWRPPISLVSILLDVSEAKDDLQHHYSRAFESLGSQTLGTILMKLPSVCCSF